MEYKVFLSPININVSENKKFSVYSPELNFLMVFLNAIQELEKSQIREENVHLVRKNDCIEIGLDDSLPSKQFLSILENASSETRDSVRAVPDTAMNLLAARYLPGEQPLPLETGGGGGGAVPISRELAAELAGQLVKWLKDYVESRSNQSVEPERRPTGASESAGGLRG